MLQLKSSGKSTAVTSLQDTQMLTYRRNAGHCRQTLQQWVNISNNQRHIYTRSTAKQCKNTFILE